MSNVWKKIAILLLGGFIFACKSASVNHHGNLKVKFLSEYILPENIMVDGTLVGGLSGIDFYKGTYYLACDDSDNPRFYEATISITANKISNINIDKVVKIHNGSEFLDMESIRFNAKTNQILLTSEGHINSQKDPLFFAVSPKGRIETRFKLPEAFKANSVQKPRHNGTLEGVCKAIDKKGYWIAMELPLEADGPEPQLTPTKSPVRITYMDFNTKRPERQFGYFLDAVDKRPTGNFFVNGLTDLLEYDANLFFGIERSYSSGLGNQGNTIKLFKIDATNASNILETERLKDVEFRPAKKELLLNFEDLRAQLTDHSVDNIEGITFGPLLPNGHQSLLLVSDNNFNRQGAQLNQFILLEIVD